MTRKYLFESVNNPLHLSIILSYIFFLIFQEEDIEEAIRQLQWYLNQQKRDSTDAYSSFLDHYDDDGLVNIPMRFKRNSDSDGYTEEDIRYYKLLMNSNIRHMRENMAKQKLKHLSNGIKDVKVQPMTARLKQKPLMGNLAHLRIVPSQQQQKHNLARPRGVRTRNGNRLFENVQQKTSEDSQQIPTEKMPGFSIRGEEIDDKTIQLIQAIKSELRNKRLRSTRRIKRRIDTNRMENDIKERINAVAEDAKYVSSKIDDTKISLMLPNDDVILLSNDVDEVGMEFDHSKSDISPKSEESISQSTNSNMDILMVTTIETPNETPKVVGRLKNQNEDFTHIQKVGKRREDNILDKIFKEISKFVDDVTDKISSCLVF